MEPKFLRNQDIFTCGNCGSGFGTENSKIDAEKCCMCVDCGEPKGHKNFEKRCSKCRDLAWENKRQERIKKVPAVSYSKEMHLHDDKDKFLIGDDDLYSYLIDEFDSMEDLPEYLFVSDKITGPLLDAWGILECALDSHHEDAMDDVDVNSLQSVLDIWVKDNEVVSYSGETKQKVFVSEIVEALKITKEDYKQ